MEIDVSGSGSCLKAGYFNVSFKTSDSVIVMLLVKNTKFIVKWKIQMFSFPEVGR